MLRGGLAWTKGAIYKILGNRIYLGQAVHKGTAYPGEHAAIVDQELWDRAHGVMAEPTRQRAATTRAQVPMLLKGLIFGPNGRAMSPSHTTRRGRMHRYYVTREAIAEGYDSCPVKSVPAADVEAAVLAQVQRLLTTPEMIARTWPKSEIAEREVLGLLTDFGSLWAELFPAEQARIVKLLVERVDVHRTGWRCGSGPRGWPASWPSCGSSRHRQGGLRWPERRLEGGTLVVRIPMRLGKQRGRKRILAPDGSELTPADQAAARRRAGQGAGPGVAVAEAARPRRLQLGHRDRRGREDQQAATSAGSSASPCWRRTLWSPSSAAGPISGSCWSGLSGRCRSSGWSSGCSSMSAEPRARATPGASAAERQRRRRQKLRLERELQFVRQDWALFLRPERLAQKAGAPVRLLRRMALKELADNAADASDRVELDQLDAETYRVGDRGPGLDRQQITALFAVNRPLTSSKLLRRPTRGAIGNGLRVVTGAAIGSGGELLVESRGRRYRVGVDRVTGDALILAEQACDRLCGTAVTVRFGAGLPADADALVWARTAAALAGPAARSPHSHPRWYDEPAWHELAHAVDGASAGELLAAFGIANDDRRPARGLTLAEARTLAEDVPEPVLLPIDADGFAGEHAIWKGRAAEVPLVVQAWATCERLQGRGRGRIEVRLLLNRTEGASELFGGFDADGAYLQGCRIFHVVPSVSRGSYQIRLAVTAPFFPTVTDGKEPDLLGLAEPIVATVGAAMRKAYRKTRRSTGMTRREAAFEVMAEAYARASAGNTLPANARQIMYAARPSILEACGLERLDDAYFTQVLLPAYLTEHPQETADWDVVYDARGHLVEPHTGVRLPLGTLQVREYLRPRSTASGGPLIGGNDPLWQGRITDRYRTVLFIEKEGFEPLLCKTRIGERFDCGIMSTKGMSVTAARALVERLSRDGVRILVAHDLDRSGFSIFGTLAGDTRRYRYEIAPEVIDLGLRLDECLAMALQDEEAPPLPPRTDQRKVALTLREYGATAAEIGFLLVRGRRVELNAMTSDQLVTWLEAGLRRHGAGKVVPAAEVLETAYRHAVARRHAAGVVRAVEAEARAVAATVRPPEDLGDAVRREIAGSDRAWDEALLDIVSRQQLNEFSRLNRATPA